MKMTTTCCNKSFFVVFYMCVNVIQKRGFCLWLINESKLKNLQIGQKEGELT